VPEEDDRNRNKTQLGQPLFGRDSNWTIPEYMPEELLAEGSFLSNPL
jgi:hypothetical protein